MGRRAAALVLFLSSIATAFAVAAADLDRRIAFNIPAQPLSQALAEFSRQSDVIVVVSSEITAGKLSQAVSETTTAEKALQRLLEGTKLVYTQETDGSIVIKRAAGALESSQTPQADRATSEDVSRDPDSGGGLQEVIVTARKRADPIQQVPDAVTAVTGSQLGKVGAGQLSDYSDLVPGLNLLSFGGTTGQNELILRGISSGASTGATVGIYVDDVPFGSSSSVAEGGLQALDLFPFDLQQVEVLKGPQGTLYGANTLSGLLKYVTNPPDPSRYAALVEADGSFVDSGNGGGGAKGMVNIPLIQDQLGFRLSAYYERDPGWIDNLGTGTRDANTGFEKGFRAGLLFAPTADLSVRLSALVQNTHADGTSYEYVNPATHQPIGGDLTQSTAEATPYDTKYRQYSATVRWDVPIGQIVSASSYSRLDELATFDETPNFGFPSFGLNGDFTRKWSQELRLVSPQGRPIEYTFGVFYTDESSGHPQDYEFTPPQATPFINAAYPSHYREDAAFADMTWHVTEKLGIGLGGRYSQIHQDFSLTETGSGIGPTPLATSGSDMDTVWNWSVNPFYKLTPDIMLYSRVATGFQPGGANIVFPGQALPATFAPDKTTNYEVGIKSEFLEHRALVNLTVFDIEWSKIQLIETFVTPSGSRFTGFGNGSDARSKGVELTTSITPIQHLTLGLNGAYTDAYLTGPAPGVGGLAGDSLPYVPRWSGSLTADYSFPIAANVSGFAGATLRHEGDRDAYFAHSLTVDTIPFELQQFTALDLRAGVVLKDWQIELYGKNVANVRGQVAATTSGLNQPTELLLLQPATVGIRASWSF
jgi:iron complex outermembrane recepter protein